MAVEKTGLDSALASIRHTYPQASPNEGNIVPFYSYLLLCNANTIQHSRSLFPAFGQALLDDMLSTHIDHMPH